MSGIIFGGTVTPSRLSPNLFKNPNFAVIQGTASGTLANSTALPTASLGYQGETEWCVAASGGTPAYAFSSANESVTFTGAASTTAIYLLQRLESRDTNRIKSKTVTFSCEISNSLLTSVIWEVFRPTTSDDTHGTIATPTQTLIASGTFTVSSSLSKYSATFTLPSEVSRGLEVRLRVGAQTSGTWVVARPQLEEGSTATDFNCGDYFQELAKCQRYFETSYPDGVAIGSSNYLSGVGGISLNIQDFYDGYSFKTFNARKFAIPVMNGYSLNGAVGVFYNFSLGVNQGNIGFRFVNHGGFNIFCINNAMTLNNAFGIHFTAASHIP
jgi:hypothetical protein